jgi:ElaB/YqjD/DUF883 family membrane-anchored ribosome-binding protein
LSLDDLKTLIGIAGVLFAGAWGIVKIVYSQKVKIENLEKQSVMTLMAQLQTQIAQVAELLNKSSERFTREIEELKKETNDLKIVQAEHITEMKTFGKAMLEVHRHFAGKAEEYAQSEKKQIGKDAWIIREKKKANGEDE